MAKQNQKANSNQSRGFQQQQRQQPTQQRQQSPPKGNQKPQTPSSAENEYDNVDRGALFENHRKTSEDQPNLSGNINIDGSEYWLSGWSKVSNKGENYVSLAITDKANDTLRYSGALYLNAGKSKENHPDMKGVLNIDGNEINIAGWFHVDKKKEKYISLQISENSFDPNSEKMPWEF